MQVRKQHLELDMEQQTGSVRQGCILSSCLFNLYAEYIMRNAGLEEAQARIKIAGRNDQSRQHVKKQRHYFANKSCLVKAMVFPGVMYECESWTIKKTEHE